LASKACYRHSFTFSNNHQQQDLEGGEVVETWWYHLDQILLYQKTDDDRAGSLRMARDGDVYVAYSADIALVYKAKIIMSVIEPSYLIIVT
jgi:hypothetical protein